MTCRTEDQRRREWYWQHMSGSRSSRSWKWAIACYGTDIDVLLLLRTTYRSQDIKQTLLRLLVDRHDSMVLAWLSGTDMIGHGPSPLEFNSRSAAKAAELLYRYSGVACCSASDIDAYWDFRDDGIEPLALTPNIVVWAIHTENRAFFLKHRDEAPNYYASVDQEGVSDDFYKFLIENGWIDLGSAAWKNQQTLGHLQLALHHGMPLINCRCHWSRRSMARDAWLAKKLAWDLPDLWRQYTRQHQARPARVLIGQYTRQHQARPARVLIELMEYHHLPWTGSTLAAAINEGDYAAIVWHLKQPTRAVDLTGRIDYPACAMTGRLVEDLIANHWLTIDPDTCKPTFHTLVQKEVTLRSY